MEALTEYAERMWRGEATMRGLFADGAAMGGAAPVADGVAVVPGFANVIAFQAADGLVLAATGHANEELKTHLRGALHLGWTVDELREALLQIGGCAGFPAAHEALDVLSEIVTQS